MVPPFEAACGLPHDVDPVCLNSHLIRVWIAQLAERWPPNPDVEGSIPSLHANPKSRGRTCIRAGDCKAGATCKLD